MASLRVIALLCGLVAASSALAQFSAIPTMPQPVIVVPPPAIKMCCREECLPQPSCRRGETCLPVCNQKCSPCTWVRRERSDKFPYITQIASKTNILCLIQAAQFRAYAICTHWEGGEKRWRKMVFSNAPPRDDGQRFGKGRTGANEPRRRFDLWSQIW